MPSSVRHGSVHGVANAIGSVRPNRTEYFTTLFVVADTGTVGDDNTLTSEVAPPLAHSRVATLVDTRRRQNHDLHLLGRQNHDCVASR